MKMKFLLMILCLVILSNKVYSQNTDLPQLLPPTPEAASIIRTGMGNVNYSTGAVTASVPLYEFKNGPIKLSVGLSYQTQGLKVEELAGRVGLGWALHAGGVITRSVHGKPDETSDLQTMPANLTQINSSNLSFLNQASSADPLSTFDTEPDEFFFCFNGYSGKFVLDANHNPVLISKDNLKITVDAGINNIYIITGDGTKYIFGGGAVESTLTLSGNYKVHTKTAFYLKNIIALSGQEISFTYQPITTSSSVGIQQTILEKPTTSNGEQYTVSLNYPVPTCTNGITSDITSSWVTYSSYYLSSITSSNGQYAAFSYTSKNDLSGDVKLNMASFLNEGVQLNKYRFTYYDPQYAGVSTPDGGIAKNGRMFLTKVSQVNNDNSDSLVHSFEYNDMENITASFFTQDFMGYNNSNTSTSLIPAIPNHPVYSNADRSPDWQKARQGTLKKIIFPTGGIEEFEYEANTVDTVEKLNTVTNYAFLNSGIGSDGFATIHSSTYDQPNIPSQSVSFKIRTFIDPAYTGTTNFPSDLTKVLYVKVRDMSTMAIVYNNYIEGIHENIQELSFQSNYRIEVEVRGPSYIKGEVNFMYDYAVVPVYVRLNKEVPGVRVKKISSTDPVTKQVLNKYFTYAGLTTLNRSSGIGQLEGQFSNQVKSLTDLVPNFIICTNYLFHSQQHIIGL